MFLYIFFACFNFKKQNSSNKISPNKDLKFPRIINVVKMIHNSPPVQRFYYLNITPLFISWPSYYFFKRLWLSCPSICVRGAPSWHSYTCRSSSHQLLLLVGQSGGVDYHLSFFSTSFWLNCTFFSVSGSILGWNKRRNTQIPAIRSAGYSIYFYSKRLIATHITDYLIKAKIE